MKLYTLVTKPMKQLKTHHYAISDLAQIQSMLPPDILIIDDNSDGVFLNRYTLKGEFAGDTWHTNMHEAKKQASFEFGEALTHWQDVPEDIEDTIKYILDQLSKN